MKFKMIWFGPEDESSGQPSVQLEPPKASDKQSPGRYGQDGPGMVRQEQLRNGRIKITAIANFTAVIRRDIVCDDDEQPTRAFGIEAEVGGRKCAFVLPVTEFGSMNWVLRELGPQAIVYPGQHQHARAAIQYLSTDVGRENIFTHLGWRKHGSGWIYLHAGGVLGPAGRLADWHVRLPLPLQNYRMCPPAGADTKVKAVRSSLGLLSVAPDRISLPLLAAIYRAPLGAVDFGVFVTGRTGTFKTALAALCQQHFGAAMDASGLPGNFASTPSALEELAFAAKDALMVVDDFAPTGAVGDSTLYAVAERLFRSAGNQQGRSRMRGQQHLDGCRFPRGMLLATGEEMPRGHSLRARLLILQVKPGEVDLTALSECQQAAHSGLFARAMAAYLEWISARYDRLQECLRARVIELRQRVHPVPASFHPRLPTTLSELQAGLEKSGCNSPSKLAPSPKSREGSYSTELAPL